MSHEIHSLEQLLDERPDFLRVTRGERSFYVCPDYSEILDPQYGYGRTIRALAEVTKEGVSGFEPLAETRIGSSIKLETATKEEDNCVKWSYGIVPAPIQARAERAHRPSRSADRA